MPRSKRSLHRTAIHEAGHAVMAYLVGRRIGALSAVARGQVLGHLEYRGFTAFREGALDHARTRRKLETEILIALAGLAAEHLQPGRINRVGAALDVQRAVDIALAATSDRDEASAFVNCQQADGRQRRH